VYEKMFIIDFLKKYLYLAVFIPVLIILAGTISAIRNDETTLKDIRNQDIIIGYSFLGKEIKTVKLGFGSETALILLAGIHGDEGNTVKLLEAVRMKILQDNLLIPPTISLFLVPCLNPDGYELNTRHNANNVDLNRNFPTDDWMQDACTSIKLVPGSGGESPASEPEVAGFITWVKETIIPEYQKIFLVSYHSPYPPKGCVQPGYIIKGQPGEESEKFALLIAGFIDYDYLADWPGDYALTGELIHWCETQGIVSVDIELPDKNSPDTVPEMSSESTVETHYRLLKHLLDTL
jgi:hypothetical protein